MWTATQVSDDAWLLIATEGVTLWMSGPLDIDALRASLDAVVARHEALQSTFSADGLTMLIAAESAIPVRSWMSRAARRIRSALELRNRCLAREASERFGISRTGRWRA